MHAYIHADIHAYIRPLESDLKCPKGASTMKPRLAHGEHPEACDLRLLVQTRASARDSGTGESVLERLCRPARHQVPSQEDRQLNSRPCRELPEAMFPWRPWRVPFVAPELGRRRPPMAMNMALRHGPALLPEPIHGFGLRAKCGDQTYTLTASQSKQTNRHTSRHTDKQTDRPTLSLSCFFSLQQIAPRAVGKRQGRFSSRTLPLNVSGVSITD